MSKDIIVRIEIEPDIWSKVKARAYKNQKYVKDYAAELLEKGVNEEEGGPP